MRPLAVWVGIVCATVWVPQVQARGKDAPATPPAAQGEGTLDINITDVLSRELASRVDLRKENDTPGGGRNPAVGIVMEVPTGRSQTRVPAGRYTAYVYVYNLLVPVLVDAKKVAIEREQTAFLAVNLLEGATGNRLLFDFDADHDFALDSVETACGTNPRDAASIPGKALLPLDDRVLAKKEGWYRGELHAYSTYGAGQETVAQLVKRAQKAGLDFLAITDRNTMAACMDPDFTSDSVVLIPAMEWGTDEKGVALIYGPRTFPDLVKTIPEAQALVDLVQAQGGLFAVAHPCFATAPWQWGLSYVNAVEIWCRDWNKVPPMSLEQLGEDFKERMDGKLVHSIAFAAASPGLSANGQASVFYDSELLRGLKAAAIAGSRTASPNVPMGQPLTYVFAKEKSVRGILDGLRNGRTYISAGPKGPKLYGGVDLLKDGKIDLSFGGVMPLMIPAKFEVIVENAKGKTVQILLNGYPLISKDITNNAFALRFEVTPENYSVYRLRVIDKAKKNPFGMMDVLAMSSPIYAHDVNVKNEKIEAYKRRAYDQPPPPDVEVQFPATPGEGEIIPKFKF